jgi:uncharacterized protein YfaS (alpha-2-macroglobulin family)
VNPPGFPISRSFAGKIVAGGSASAQLKVSADAVRNGTLAIKATLLTSPLASMTEALAGLLSQPCGCFEQASSSTYPNVMVMKYFASHAGVDPALAKKCRDYIDKGLKLLLTYEQEECDQDGLVCRGYSWFSGRLGHAALSAYPA